MPFPSGSDNDLRKQTRRSSADFVAKSACNLLLQEISACLKLLALGNFEIDEDDVGDSVAAGSVDIDREKLPMFEPTDDALLKNSPLLLTY